MRFTQAFEEAVRDATILRRAATDLAGRAGYRTSQSGQAVLKMSLTLTLEKRQFHEITLVLRQPLSEARAIDGVLQHTFERLRVPMGVEALELTLDETTSVQPRQLSLFDEPESSISPETVAAQLIQRMSTHGCYRVVPADPESPIPERRYVLEILAAS